jgi:hypothetical protein
MPPVEPFFFVNLVSDLFFCEFWKLSCSNLEMDKNEYCLLIQKCNLSWMNTKDLALDAEYQRFSPRCCTRFFVEDAIHV